MGTEDAPKGQRPRLSAKGIATAAGATPLFLVAFIFLVPSGEK